MESCTERVVGQPTARGKRTTWAIGLTKAPSSRSRMTTCSRSPLPPTPPPTPPSPTSPTSSSDEAPASQRHPNFVRQNRTPSLLNLLQVLGDHLQTLDAHARSTMLANRISTTIDDFAIMLLGHEVVFGAMAMSLRLSLLRNGLDVS